MSGRTASPTSANRPGTLGGHRRSRIYGRLECRAALRAIARGGYVADRVFFLNQAHARAAGYRPCGVCLPKKYKAWNERTNEFARKIRSGRKTRRR